jgi:hypothetical protein
MTVRSRLCALERKVRERTQQRSAPAWPYYLHGKLSELAIEVLAELPRDAKPVDVGRAMRAVGVAEAEVGWCKLLMTV